MINDEILDAARLTMTEAAQRLRKHVSTLYRWHYPGVRGRRLTTFVIGANRYVLVSDLAEWVAEGFDRVAPTNVPEVSISQRAIEANQKLSRRGV